MEALADENSRLRDLLEMSSGLKWEHIGGTIISRVFRISSQAPFQIITIDVGTNDGVREDFCVLDGSAVVGQIVNAGPRSSKALLLTDPNCSPGARVLRTGDVGIIQGDGKGGCILKYLDAAATLEIGDTVVTADGGAVYPPGLVIGRVSGIDEHAPVGLN